MAARTKMDPGTNKPKYRYRVTNWANYDRALMVSRGDLMVRRGDDQRQLDAPPPVGRGKPGLYSALAIQTCLTLKTLFRLPTAPPKG